MAGAEDPNLSEDFEVQTWRIVLIFLFVLLIDFAWEFVDEWTTHRIRSKQRKGLLHAWEQLKFEMMALGLVSLLLVVFEVWHALLQCCRHICVYSPAHLSQNSAQLLTLQQGTNCRT
jgi:hypothetical protein